MNELLGGIEELILPAGIEIGHGCHLYVVRLDSRKVPFSRDDLTKELKECFGVQTALHYPAVWSWEAFRNIDHDLKGCPVAERGLH